MQEKEYDVPEPPEKDEHPQCQDMGPEYSSDEAGDGPHSSNEYDPEDNTMRRCRQQQKKRKRKHRKKGQRDGRSKEYENRSKRRTGLENHTGDVEVD